MYLKSFSHLTGIVDSLAEGCSMDMALIPKGLYVEFSSATNAITIWQCTPVLSKWNRQCALKLVHYYSEPILSRL